MVLINRFGEYTLKELEGKRNGEYKDNEELLIYLNSLKSILKNYNNESYYPLETKLFYLLERREVYDTMVNCFKEENKERILEIIQYRNEKKISGFPLNVSQFNFFDENAIWEKELSWMERENILNDYRSKLRHIDLSSEKYFMMCEAYDKSFFTTEYEINELTDFLLFHCALKRFCGRYTQSQNGGQSVTAYIKELIKLNNIYIKSLKSLNEKYDYDEE